MESERQREAPGSVPEGTLNLAASLMLRRAAGKPYESTPVIQRLKAAQRGMQSVAGIETRGTSNHLLDLERSIFSNGVAHLVQREIAGHLFASLTASNPQPDVQQLRACWPEALLEHCRNAGLPREHHNRLLLLVAGTAMSRIGSVKNCGEQVIENIAHHDAAVLNARSDDVESTYATGGKGIFSSAFAGDHAWLEVQHPQSDGELLARPDDLIICTWSGEHKVPLFREDAFYPASSRRRTKFTVPGDLAKELPRYLDEFARNLRACLEVRKFIQKEMMEKAPRRLVHKRFAENIRGIEQQKLPVSVAQGLYPVPPHPLKPATRAAARRGLTELDGFARDVRHSDIVATRIARDLGVPVREATRYAPHVFDIAKKMAAEPRHRRLLASKDKVFDDSEALQEPREILASLDGLGKDIERLHQALWRFEDALLPADGQQQDGKTLQENASALRDWWRQADVPLPIHAHVFDILAKDLVADQSDFGQLTDMILKLPVFMQSAAMLDRVLSHLATVLKMRRPSKENADAFKTKVRPEVEFNCLASPHGLTERDRQWIKVVLDLASGVPVQPPVQNP